MVPEAREGHPLEEFWKGWDDQEMIEEFHKIMKQSTRNTLKPPHKD